jgi:hypothetical protein
MSYLMDNGKGCCLFVLLAPECQEMGVQHVGIGRAHLALQV